MPDVFNRGGANFGGSFSADGAAITFSTGGAGTGTNPGLSGGVGLLTQSMGINYSQQVSRLFEIGSQQTFLVAGRTSGQASIARILGPRAVQVQFYKNYGDVCNAANNNITVSLSANCGSNAALGQGSYDGQGKMAFIVRNLVIVGLGISAQAQEMIINEQLQAMFVALETTSAS